MGMLTSNQIRRLVTSHSLIKPGAKPDMHATADTWRKSWEERLRDIESGAFDCTVEGVYVPDPKCAPYLGENSRVTPKEIPVDPIEPIRGDKKRTWMLKPGQYYLVKCREELRLPMFLTGMLDTRTTLFRCGHSVDYGPVQAGFDGQLTLGVTNHLTVPMPVRECARCITIRFALFASDEELDDALARRVIGNDRNHSNWTGDKMGTGGQVEVGY